VEMELTKSKKSSGLMWPLWGTPEVASNVFEEEPSIDMNYFLPVI